MVREGHRMNRPDVVTDPLQREHGGGVADMAVGDVGLDGENIHDGGVYLARRYRPLMPQCPADPMPPALRLATDRRRSIVAGVVHPTSGPRCRTVPIPATP